MVKSVIRPASESPLEAQPNFIAPPSLQSDEFTNHANPSVWLFCESDRTSNYLRSRLSESMLQCTRCVTTSELKNNVGRILTQLRDERPSFIWFSALHHDPNRAIPEETQIAVRLLISEQETLGGSYLLEGVSSTAESMKGIFLSEMWRNKHQAGHMHPVWWCSLGVGRTSTANCSVTQVFSSISLPKRVFNCCRHDKFTGRSLLPSRLPKSYYHAMTAMLNEHVQTAFAYKAQKKQKPRPPKPGFEDSPGEHADMEAMDKPASGKEIEIEDVYADCGDDVSTIALSEASESFFCYDTDDDEFERDPELDFVFTTLESTFDYPDMSSAFHAMSTSHQFSGQHDVCELFGGEGGVSKICFRRGMKTGPCFDVMSGFDLTDAKQIDALWKYLIKFRPRVIICAPPCTSFGAWSRINKIRAYDTWLANRRIGEILANLTADICLWQLANRRHFLVENPAQSEMWQLPCWLAVLKDPRVCTALLHQCQVGLVDPEGLPTLKPTKLVASCNSLVRRLRRKCPGLHRHALLAGAYKGIARCRFAQVWPTQLKQLVADGVAETLANTSAYPVRAAPAVQDPFGGRAPRPVARTCPGCVAHARKNDKRHDRRVGICRFPYDEAVDWKCPACVSNRPSTHQAHLHDDTCQWTDAQVRNRGAVRTPGVLREPRLKSNNAPAVAAIDSPDTAVPDPWKPLTNLEVITLLDFCRGKDGWHRFGEDRALVLSNGRAFRGPGASLDQRYWKWRSSFGLFPEAAHNHGNWYQHENRVNYVEQDADEFARVQPFGYPIPILVLVFHKSAVRPIINNTRDAGEGPPSNVGLPARSSKSSSSKGEEPPNPLDELIQQWEAEEDAGGEPEEGNEPPEAPEAQEEAPHPEDINIVPEWSSYDMGASLRALRSGTIPQKNRALRRLHLRWWHATPARMTSLLRAAGVPAVTLKLIASICDTCAVCRMWARPGHRSMVTTRFAEKFNESVEMDLLFVESHIILHLIDTHIRWTSTTLLEDRNASTIIKAITRSWLRLYGPMTALVSDQEGGLTGDQAAIWAERWKLNLLLKAKNQHANIAERHHDILRVLIHKMLAQAKAENLLVEFEDVLAEATFVKNAMLQIGGTTPYVALLGRFPMILAEFENQSISGATENVGGSKYVTTC